MVQESDQFFDQRASSNVHPNTPNNYSMEGTQQHDHRKIKELAKEHMHHYVIGHLNDGTILEGIIVDVDDEAITILTVDKDALKRADDDSRQFGRFPGYFGFRPYRFPFPYFRPPFFSPFIFPFFLF